MRTRTLLTIGFSATVATSVLFTTWASAASVAAPVPTVCSGLIAGSYDPSPSTTGVRPGSTLTRVDHDLCAVAWRLSRMA